MTTILSGALLSMMTLGAPQPVPVDSARWRSDASESRVEEHLGRPSLYLKGGIASVADARFTHGAIEFDISFTGERGFMGGVWRVQDAKNYEEFYVRPHQSGNPDANQYTPVFHGVSGWQLYHGPRYTVPVKYRFDEWIHVRIVFAGSRAEIYIEDMETPVLRVDDLKRDVASGSVGVSAGAFAPAWFSNFTFQEAESIEGAGSPGPPAPPEGVISSWWVSDVFSESALEGRTLLQADDPVVRAGRRWTRLETEPSGLANLARVQGVHFRQNTVLARKVLLSDRERIAQLDFGFSDRVRVYLNGRLLYRGDDAYLSRDYRFLGSIGWFDTLYLPLIPGENELLMAVSEEIGGWGIQAKLEKLAGLTLQD